MITFILQGNVRYHLSFANFAILTRLLYETKGLHGLVYQKPIIRSISTDISLSRVNLLYIQQQSSDQGKENAPRIQSSYEDSKNIHGKDW